MALPSFRQAPNPVGVAVLLLLMVAAIPADAWQAWTREERRHDKSVEKIEKSLESPRRDAQMQPERVLDTLGVKPGDVVADIGAGTGYFSFRLAARVGPEGKVYASEIEDRLLDFMRRKIEANHVKNIVLLKAAESDANLPPRSCDKILIVGTYYYFPDAVAYVKKLRQALKPGGVIGIIDIDKERAGPRRKDRARLAVPDNIVDEMKRAGFVLRQKHDFLQARFYLIFSPVE